MMAPKLGGGMGNMIALKETAKRGELHAQGVQKKQ